MQALTTKKTHSTTAVTLLVLVWLAWTAWARPLMLPDEGRYVGVAWEMLRSGDWLTPTLNGLPLAPCCATAHIQAHAHAPPARCAKSPA